MNARGEITSFFQTLGQDLLSLCEEAEKHIPTEKKDAFRSQLKLELLNSKIDFIESISKDAKLYSNGGWTKIKGPLHESRTKFELLKRRLQLISPPSSAVFEAALKWVAEHGEDEEISLLQEIRKEPPYRSDSVNRLLEIAEKRINLRLNDPAYVTKKSEEAYQRHKAQWERDYAGQFIAIHRGEVIDSDRDESELVKRVIELQRKNHPFRVYLIEVGSIVSEARGPRKRFPAGKYRGFHPNEPIKKKK